MPRRVSLLVFDKFLCNVLNSLGNYSNWTPSNLCEHIDMTDGGCWTIPWQTLGSIGPDSGEYLVIQQNLYTFEVLSF